MVCIDKELESSIEGREAIDMAIAIASREQLWRIQALSVLQIGRAHV